MMTTKKFNKAIAEVNRTNKKNTIVASAAAGATGLVAAGITFVIGRHKNNKINEEIEKLDNKITSAVTTEAVYEKMNNPKLSDFDTFDIYMKEEDYAKMYNTAETTEDKADKK